jgi:very-short-patch-repair endonuclease
VPNSKRKPTEADILMWEQLCELQLSNERWRKWNFEKESRFMIGRRWRFDFCIDHIFIAIEIEGGAFTQGRHTRGKGFIADMEKYNHAALLGWRVLRFTPQQVLKGEAIAFIKRVLEA